MKLTKEELKQLPDDAAKAVRNGDAIVVKMHKPSMSNRFFAIVAALIVTAMLLPLFTTVSTFMYICATLAALGWAILYKNSTNEIAMLETALDIESTMLSGVLKHLKTQGLTEQETNGTSDDDTCLTKNKEDEKK